MLIAPQIKNIIFDLGGVIINLSVETTVQRLSNLTGLPATFIHEKLLKSDIFKDHEKGIVSDKDFRDSIRTELGINCTDEEIDACWNAMLLDIPQERIELLLYLKSKYRIFLLSNTNEIHLFQVIKILGASNFTFEQLFEKVYYSHRLAMRKPDKKIFEYVLNENNLIAEQTLFLDDNLDNLKGAEAVGIHTFHVQQPESLLSLFEFGI